MYITAHHGNYSLESFTEKVEKKLWEKEDFKPFCGFDNHRWYFHCSGRYLGFRVGIIDEVIMYKYPAGSRIFVHFDNIEDAKQYWNNKIGLQLDYIVNPETRFVKNELVTISDEYLSSIKHKIRSISSKKIFKINWIFISEHEEDPDRECAYVSVIESTQMQSLHKGEWKNFDSFPVPLSKLIKLNMNTNKARRKENEN
jgi:hypothetical protein